MTIISGSCLKTDRNIFEKVKLAFSLTSTWFAEGIIYSTGSSIVIIFLPIVSIEFIMLNKVFSVIF